MLVGVQNEILSKNMRGFLDQYHLFHKLEAQKSVNERESCQYSIQEEAISENN